MLAVALLFAFAAKVACKGYYFDVIDNSNNLSSNNVRSIYEDSIGFIWFCTKDGLSRYDGINCIVYRHSNEDSLSISSNDISCIIGEPGTGNLWVGTVEGLNYFNRGKQTFTRYLQHPINNNIGSNNIMTLKYGEDSTLWIGTNGSLDAYKNGVFKHYYIDPGIYSNTDNYKMYTKIIKTIFVEKDRLLIGTGEALYQFDLHSHQFGPYNAGSKLLDVRSIYKDSKGNLWFSSYINGLFVMKQGTDFIINIQEALPYPHQITPEGIAEDEKGNILVTNRDAGLNVVDLGNATIDLLVPSIDNDHSLNSKALVCIEKTNHGVIWIGTYNSGANFYHPQRKVFNTHKVTLNKQGLINENIRSVFQDSEDNIWIGTKENGCLSQYHKETDSFTHYLPNHDNPASLHGDYIFSIAELDKDHLLVGTLQHGINIFNKRTGKARHVKNLPGDSSSLVSNIVFSFWVKNKNEIWVGTAIGLEIWLKNKNTFKHLKQIKDVRCFFQQDKNRIWVGTRWGGIFVLDTTYQVVEHYLHDYYDTNSIGRNEIASIKRGPDNTIWICTGGGGLNYYIPEINGFGMITEEDGLAKQPRKGYFVSQPARILDEHRKWLNRLPPQTRALKKLR
ncbi:MAG: hypothetical protein HC896_02940 [Bacteroidales bacterium]|nr:hypothetical protein [Bacteroidales bacterium]